MSKAAIKTSAAATAATMKTATTKTTGETMSNYHLTTPSVRLVLKRYGLSTNNKFAMSFDTKGSTNIVLIQFSVNSVLPEKGGYLAMMLEDGHAIRWSRPINSFLFTIEHLCSILGRKNLESNVRVCLFDKVTQAQGQDQAQRKPELLGETPGVPPQ